MEIASIVKNNELIAEKEWIKHVDSLKVKGETTKTELKNQIVNAIEKKSFLAFLAFLVGLSSWILYGMNVYSGGIAIPEIISFGAVASLLQLSAISIYFKNR